MSRKITAVRLHPKQVKKLKKVIESKDKKVVRRATILNCLHQKMTPQEISLILNVSDQTVRNIACKFLKNGLDGALYDKSRPGRPIIMDDRIKSHIIAMVCSDPPEGHHRWTLSLIVHESLKRGIVNRISDEKVRIILKEHDLKPWKKKMWCIPKLNETYIERMENILDVYEKPYHSDYPVICLDEKSVQMLADTRERQYPKKKSEILKVDYTYKRLGTANVFCALEPKAGAYFTKVTPNRSGMEFALFLEEVAEKYSESKKINLVLDNLSTHKISSLVTCFGQEKADLLWSRFEVHYTPVHASGLNQAEMMIGMYSKQCLGDGRVQSLDRLRSHTFAWTQYINKKQTKIKWKFNKIDARKKMGYKNDVF